MPSIKYTFDCRRHAADLADVRHAPANIDCV